MRLLDSKLTSPNKLEAILTAPYPMSTFVTVTRRRRDKRDNQQENDNVSDSSLRSEDDADMQQLSTLAESNLCISLQQEVTTCQELAVLPTTTHKEMYSGEVPAISSISEEEYNRTADLVGRLAMETQAQLHPFDEPPPVAHPTPSSYLSVGGVPGFPDFAWADDNGMTTQQSNSNNKSPCDTFSNWQERRRMESRLLAAAATPAMTKGGVKKASTRLEHARSLRKLRKLRRKSVNLAVRGSKRHRRLFEEMEVDGKDKYSTVDHHDDSETTIEWERERSGTAKGTERYRAQSCNRRKNHIHKVKKSVRGWRHDFHIRRFELAKNGGGDNTTKAVSNMSKLGQEEFAKRNRQQRALNDLQREMSYLGL